MPSVGNKVVPALTYTLTDFVDSGKSDDMVYSNFAIFRYISPVKYVEQNVLDYYLTELKSLCNKVTLSNEDIIKYKYNPTLLSYDVYGSTQLDFIILLANGMIDPKEFDLKRGYLMLPTSSILKEFLSSVYNSESEWIAIADSE